MSAPTAREIRARVDAVASRVLPDGRINARYVAIEQTLRQRHALPAYIAELDGPGNFRQPATEEAARQEWTNTANFAMAFVEDRLARGVLTAREIGEALDEAWEAGWRAGQAASSEARP